MSLFIPTARQIPITPFTGVPGPDVQLALQQLAAATPAGLPVIVNGSQGVDYGSAIGPGSVPLAISQWMQVVINSTTYYIPLFSEDLSDPLWAQVALLVRGDTGFADLSTNNIPPVQIGAPLSTAPPGPGWANDTILRFVRANLSAVSYTKVGGFLDSNAQDVTIEVWSDMDSGLSYDTGIDDRGSFLRLTDSGVLSFRMWLDNFAPLYQMSGPNQFSTGVSATAGRSHLAFVRDQGGARQQAWVNGTRVHTELGAPILWNFDSVRWGMGNDLVSPDRRAQGYNEELRITKAARYNGVTITVPPTPLPAY